MKPTKENKTGYRCPACHKLLSKKYRRSLSPLEWEKLQTAYWMTAWHKEHEMNVELMKVRKRHEKV